MILEYCADVIALYQGESPLCEPLVLVERLTEPKGYGLPGGRRDLIDGRLESVLRCAVREFREETGLCLVPNGMLNIYDAPGRDPRGPKISTVVHGRAYGRLRSEAGKTRAFLMESAQIDRFRDRFVFDHYQMLMDWRARSRNS